MASKVWADIQWPDGKVARVGGGEVVSDDSELKERVTKFYNMPGLLDGVGYYPNTAQVFAEAIVQLLGGEVVAISKVDNGEHDPDIPEPIY